MQPTLTLFQDIYADDVEAVLPKGTRMLFVTHGGVTIGEHTFADGEAWQGEDPARVRAGEAGVNLWRWELTSGPAEAWSAEGVRSSQLLSAPLHTLPDGDLLLRGDSVAFPPGGCAYRHVHRGPGIRCMIEGTIRIDVNGHSTSMGPGGPWFEAGPDPVFAQAAADRSSRFIRVMVLPRALLGQSSIRYVDPADQDRPKTQQYKVFIDMPIAFRKGA